ncbi:MarR family winged helix-turn-helix transcriptional regulator [Frondihabitans australicus]|uniref:DNA-binding MarR family transcriptional regulator n=1 Tax=Frondihabitans australicus TaxID=386892 RepID=A0A495IF53_9MICO|nr:MarR family transcriptional regulator [Frondihabitans australicus]RKR74270.1 DNA-binding MarR family transcriptional regulator [Frondihabitans australicus]
MDSTAAELNRLFGPLRRAAVRATRAEAGLPDLPEAHVEILRALADHHPQSPGELAENLRLARSTVSNLIKAMVAAGLIRREADVTDSRSTSIYPTDSAIDNMRRYDEAGTQVLARALATMTEGERRTLGDAAPILSRLVDLLTSHPLPPRPHAG